MTSFKEDYRKFQELGAEILAISADSLDSHRKFAEKLGGVRFPMLSDTEGRVIQMYGVGKETGPGARRSIFVLDREGRVVHANTQYSVSDYKQYDAILQALRKE